MSTIEQPDAARIEANAAAIAVNPVYENERLAELTHWGAPGLTCAWSWWAWVPAATL